MRILFSCHGAYGHFHPIAPMALARPVLFDGPPGASPPWLAILARPSAYVTFGTVPAFSRPEILRSAVEAIEPLVSAVVLTTGPNPPDTVGIRSQRVHVVEYLPQSQILPNVDLVVSHGGAGTTLGALAYGLPHLVMPGAAASQQRNAMRTEAIGLGMCVPQDAEPGRVRAAAQRSSAIPPTEPPAPPPGPGWNDFPPSKRVSASSSIWAEVDLSSRRVRGSLVVGRPFSDSRRPVPVLRSTRRGFLRRPTRRRRFDSRGWLACASGDTAGQPADHLKRERAVRRRE